MLKWTGESPGGQATKECSRALAIPENIYINNTITIGQGIFIYFEIYTQILYI